MPIRIQRKRSKGWRLPPNTVYVGRPTPWGNPFKVGNPNPERPGYILTTKDVVCLYEVYLTNDPDFQLLIVNFLRGKNLACWCKLDQPCHADILLRIANQ
jgi:hypothetical protein